MENYGLWALVPPLLAIALAFVTKQVLISLFLGILAGGIIIGGGNPFVGIAYSLETISGSISDIDNAKLLLFNLLMGAGIAYIWKLGGSKALTSWARTKVKSRKSANIGAWLLGILVFFNDYVNAAIVGNVFRDISEEQKISSEKLSYILDSTAAPVATFFISDWIVFQIAMVQIGLTTAGITSIGAFEGYLRGIPFNFYCIFAVIFVGIIAITEKDFGPMLKAEHRALTEGKIIADGSQSMMNVGYELGEPKDILPKMSTFFLPLIALVGVTLFGFWWTGREASGIMEILGASDPITALLWGAFAMTFTGIALSLIKKRMTLKESMDTLLDGLKLMLLACVILVLAWSIGTVTQDMGLAKFIITVLGDNISFTFLPIAIFITGMFVSFATGTSWGTMTILTPIAIPLAYHITGDPLIAVAMSGVVFSGAIFGDHCSPISDTTVLASIFAGADHMDHVATQIPYALATAFVAFLMYVLFGAFNLSPILLVLIGIVILVILTYALSNFSSKKYGIRLDTKKANN